MRATIVAMVVALAVGSATAQTMEVWINPSTASHGPFARVQNDGQVFIDWRAAEQTAADPNSDPCSKAYARLMLAIRAGTWKSMVAK